MSIVMKFSTGPGLISWIPGLHGPFKPEEVTQYYLFATVAAVSIACIGWFFFTSLFYESSPPEYIRSSARPFTSMKPARIY